ncbi:MAG: copper oxidase [Parachlamydiaceae bacterium]|nr:copper oxidase [Parachlamydiaceae bacterium]
MDQIEQSQKNTPKSHEDSKNDDRVAQAVLKYPSVITPNVGSLPWIMDDDVKVFHLIAEPIRREFSPGFWVNCWGYNGSSPGPTIETVEGDRVRIYVTNKLNEPTSVHWHGIILPNGMDGVSGLNQKAIQPGETFKYEFTLKQNGTFMYHPHTDEMIQIALGMEGFFIIHPKDGDNPPVDRDFAIFLHEWRIPMGAKTPMPFEMLDFNLFTFNSVLYPSIESLVVKTGDHVRIRFGNVMMNTHPIHLHGHEFLVTRRGAKKLPLAAQYSEVTVLVAPGETRDIELIADNPGDWALHCHKSHHTMNQMQHDMPNLIGIDKQGLEERIKQFFPDFMGLMNINGMGDMFEMYGTQDMMNMGYKIKYPPNLSPIGSPGPFGVIEMGGMFTVFKVRNNLTNYADPGWYQHPPGTIAKAVNMNELQHNMPQHEKSHLSKHKINRMQNRTTHQGPRAHNMHQMNMQNQNMQNSLQDWNNVSWFSREENKKEIQNQEGGNWMQSKPEDSMAGHMMHGKDGAQHNMHGMSQENKGNMPNPQDMNQIHPIGH